MVNINVCYDHGKDLKAFNAWETIKEINLMVDNLLESSKKMTELIDKNNKERDALMKKHEQKLKEYK